MKLVFATHNKNKYIEVKTMLPKHIELLSLDDIGCNEEIEETADTIEGNAILKANYVRDNYKLDCFADDTGLEVKSLNNEPGIYSARYAGDSHNSEANIKKLLKNLEGKEDRSARFKTAIALTLNRSEIMFLGICEGEITKELRGESGFGYDPIFQPKGFDKTFAEMTLTQKSKIGHRGKAMRQLIDYLSK
ncbi:non-canonical purine NTP diphosphatase [Aequorivita lipolytica]|uniref:dITP/XTP pyrophosphatase n=1 Tax=Aequorivita lipolytica TaxID=153267 RepID=A0A5C6YR40_9FLAO|nr:non-canonical purine NTP diphosphatase [Aequorivita lipolytica]TXD69453.1 non-canonical purine NTP diphosphatase [Aequorivita lipolytica]SRX50926.1 Non-canonical purine NTP pyrophosphatase [Aequorivita lipolytica]